MDRKKILRLLLSFLLAFLSFVALVCWFLVRPNPGRFYYNLTANGFLPFMLTIMFTIYGAVAWPLLYAIHRGMSQAFSPRPGNKPEPPPGLE